MNIKSKLIIICLLCIPFLSFSQTSEIKGIATDAYNMPLENAVVKVKETNDSAMTDSSGAFILSNIPYGNYTLIISAEDFADYSIPLDANQQKIDLGNTVIRHRSGESTEENIPVVTLSESDLKESANDNVSSALAASRDPFISATSFTFSSARFRIRGYEDENFVTLMNGAPMNDLTAGRTMYYTYVLTHVSQASSACPLHAT